VLGRWGGLAGATGDVHNLGYFAIVLVVVVVAVVVAVFLNQASGPDAALIFVVDLLKQTLKPILLCHNRALDHGEITRCYGLLYEGEVQLAICFTAEGAENTEGFVAQLC
jgi:hypothetical protein